MQPRLQLPTTFNEPLKTMFGGVAEINEKWEQYTFMGMYKFF